MNPLFSQTQPNWDHPTGGDPINDYVRDGSDMDANPTGYVAAFRPSSEPGRNGRRSRLLLPVSLLEQMESEKQQARLALVDDSQPNGIPEKEDPSGSRQELNQFAPKQPAASGAPEETVNANAGNADRPSSANCLPPLPQVPGGANNRRSQAVKVFEQTELERLRQATKSTDRQREARAQDMQKRLNSQGVWRHHLYPLCQHGTLGDWPNKNEKLSPDEVGARLSVHGVTTSRQAQQAHIRSSFAPLDAAHPHFAAVTDAYRTSALAVVGDEGPNSVMAPPPVLLLGVPGLGKTHYAKALANVLGLPFFSLAFDSGLTNSVLIGSDKHWSNTHHGALFEHLCLGAVANPIMLLDELDKGIGAKDGHQSALAALHSCLEPISAKRVKDISVEVEFDASHVIWIATANDKHQIPPTILSRFTVFEVLPPVGEDAYWVTWYLCQTVLQTDGQGMEMPSGEIRSAMSVFSPRQQRQSLQQAIQKARAAGRQKLRASDFGGVVQQELQESRPLNQTVRPNGKRKTMQTQWIH